MVHFIVGLEACVTLHAACSQLLTSEHIIQPSTAARCGDPRLGYKTRYILARPLLFLPCYVNAGQVWPVQCR